MNKDLCVTCPNREAGFCAQGIAERQFRIVRRGRLISSQNAPSHEVLVLCEGWAAHFMALSDSRRQIVGFLLPGDLFTPTSLRKDLVDCSVLAVTDVQVSVSSRSVIATRCEQDAGLQRIVSESIAEKLNETRRLLAAVAQGSAEERIAFLILHLSDRIRRRNVVRDERYLFPLLQQHMADALGLTSVHVSRVMASFRARGWMRLHDGVLEIFNRRELERIGSF